MSYCRLNTIYTRMKEMKERIEELENKNAELVKTAETFQSTAYKLSDQLTEVIEIMGNLFEIIKRPYQFTALRKMQMVNEAEQFFKDKSQNKWVNPITTMNDPFVR